MPMASMDNLGAHLGLYEVETPSGLKVEITPEEEAAITKDVILWKLRQDLTADERPPAHSLLLQFLFRR